MDTPPASKRLFLSYSSPDSEHVARDLWTQLRGGRAWLPFFAPESNRPGANWREVLRHEIASTDVVVFLLDARTRESTQQVVEYELAREFKVPVLPVWLDDSDPLPELRQIHGVQTHADDPRTVARILRALTRLDESPTPSTAPSWEPLVQKSFRVASEPLARWLHSLASRPKLERRCVDFLAAVARRCFLDNTERAVDLRLTHTGRVLHFAAELALPSLPPLAPSKSEDRFELADVQERALAVTAVLLHNLCLLPKLPQLFEEKEYLKRNAHFHERTRIVQRALAAELGLDAEHGWMSTVFHLAVEMHRDSLAWSEGVRPEQVRWRARARPRYRTLARLLRLCDAMDVGYRFVPDLVRRLFQRLQYDEGLYCYYQHTFERGAHPLLAGAPQIEGHTLVIPWADYADWPGSSSRAIKHATQLARRIVIEDVRRVLKRIRIEEFKELRRRYANFAIRVEDRTAPQVPGDASVVAHLSWPLFPLAISQSDSETDAARTTAQLLPFLVRYICDGGTRLQRAGGVDAAGQHARRQTDLVLDKLPLLRPNSQALLEVIAVAREALQGHESHEYFDRMTRAMATYERALDTRDKRWSAVATEARGFVSFGVSRPVAAWLVEVARLAAARKWGRIEVRCVFCRRHFVERGVVTGGGLNDYEALAPQEIDALMAARLGRANEKLAAGSLAVSSVDSFSLPQIVDTARREGQRWELLLGAKAITVLDGLDGRRASAVTSFGSRALSLLCGALGVPTRLVTWDARLAHPATSYTASDQRAGGFQISYGLVPEEGADDELLPLREISLVTTENGTWSGDDAAERAFERAG